MTDNNPTIFLSAAEASGDAHAARLIAALKARCPEARFVGLGGPQMAAAGCELLEDPTEQASMLLAGPLKKLGYYRALVRRMRKAIGEIRPDAHVPVDSPALNWHLAAAAKQAGSKVVYYIAPQVWAWAPWRVKKLARLTDAVACILPFEQDWLRPRDVNATYVGHPLFDALGEPPQSPPDLAHAWASGQWRIVLLPGSRPGEIANHAAAMAATAAAIRQRWPEAKCTFAPHTEKNADRIRGALADVDSSHVQIEVGRTRELLAEAHFALAASGTITLEVAHYGVPMVVVYRVGRLMYHTLAPILLRTPHLSLVNILAGRKIVPELMPWFGRQRELDRAALSTMEDLGGLAETRNTLREVTAPLHAPSGQTASDNAAKLILAEIGRSGN